MEDSRKQYSVKFIDELKPNYIGLPADLAVYLANLVNKSLAKELLELPNEISTEADKYQHGEALKTFINCSLFKIWNLRVVQDFRAYIVEHEYIEISSEHRDNLKDDYAEVRLIANQHDMERRWLALKIFIDQSDLKQKLLYVWDRQDQRDREIIFKIYGIYGFKEIPVRDIAAEYNLSKARVYQIFKLFERVSIGRIRRVASIVRSKVQHNESTAVGSYELKIRLSLASGTQLIDWLIEFGDMLLNYRIGFANAFDYLSLKFPDEYLVLKKLVPYVRDRESFFNFLADMGNQFVTPMAHSFDNPIVSDLSLIKRMTDIDIAGLPLPIRTINVLKASEIHTADQLARLTLDQMYHMPNLGRKSINSILDFFKLYEA